VDELQTELDGEAANLTHEQRIAMQVDLALLAGFRAMRQRNIEQAETFAHQAMKNCQLAGMTEAIPPRLLLATAYFAQGRLHAAAELFQRLVENSFSNKYLISLSASICGLGRVFTQQGHLQKAQDRLLKDLHRMQTHAWDQYLLDVAWIYLALGELAYQRNTLVESLEYFEKASEVATRDHWDTLPAMAEVRIAKIYLSRAKLDDVHECLGRIKNYKIRVSLLHLFPHVKEDLAALYIRMGELKNAELCLLPDTIDSNALLKPECEWENIIKARLLLLQQQPAAALTLISKLFLDAEINDRQTVVIELLILQALARQEQGQTRLAVEAIQRALIIAAAEKFVRVFIDEGAPMAALLKLTLKGASADYAAYLLNQMEGDPSIINHKLNIEPLSAKELKTLELLISGLSNKEIAEALYVSPNTVKTHIKNIYQKLKVNNRVEAVAKGSKLIR